LDDVKKILERRLVKHFEYLKDPKYKASKGIFIYGYPGTGKTMLLSGAVNSLCDPNKIYVHEVTTEDITGDLKDTEATIEKFLVRIRKAAQGKEIVLIMNEVEQFIPRRLLPSGGTQCQTVHTRVSSFLRQMDNYQNANIFIMATTNHPNLVEPVFIRSGRIDYNIEVKLPTSEERKALITKYISDIPGCSSIVDIILAGTPKWVGADYEFLRRELIMDYDDTKAPLDNAMITKTLARVQNLRKKNFAKFEDEYRKFQTESDEETPSKPKRQSAVSAINNLANSINKALKIDVSGNTV